MRTTLDFEKSIAKLESKLAELQHLSSTTEFDIVREVTRLRQKVEKQLHQTYSNLKPWQKVQVARHPERPDFLSYLSTLVTDFVELAGDRNFAEDKAIIGGLGRFRGQSAVIMGQQKGRDTESRLKHNFGMARPEGYRKASRLMDLAHRFQLPLITFIDTSGAFAGIDAEARGQSEAIARCIEKALAIEAPVVTVVIGEGGSGGAVALAVANDISMLEHAVYSVISPEGCASILWRTAERKADAAAALRLTAQDLFTLGVIDRIVTEPLGGAHRSPAAAIESVGQTLESALQGLMSSSGTALKQQRWEKFLNMGKRGLS